MDVLLVNNLTSKIEAQIYLKMFKPMVKTKVASTVEAALSKIQKEKASRSKVLVK